MKLSQLNEGDFFTLDSDVIKNSYKLLSKELEPGIAGAECSDDDFIEISTSEPVTKIDGFQLYLLQGGRIWD